MLTACGSVGDPLPPLVNIPERSQDLVARQNHKGIVLEWTWPEVTTEGMPVKDLDSFLVHMLAVSRVSESVTPARFERQSRLAAALSGADLAPFTPGGTVTWTLPHDRFVGQTLTFGVRAVSRRGKSVGFSNLAVIQIREPPGDVEAPTGTLTPGGVLLTWMPAVRADQYRIYRAREREGPFDSIALTGRGVYRDAILDWDRSYFYRVQSLGISDTGEIAGRVSPVGEVFAKDVFPPSPPQRLQAVVATGSVELSWQESTEQDLAGYRASRSQPGAGFMELHKGWLPTPGYSDKTVQPGVTYQYTVTAEDQNGNESEPSLPAEVTVPQP